MTSMWKFAVPVIHSILANKNWLTLPDVLKNLLNELPKKLVPPLPERVKKSKLLSARKNQAKLKLLKKNR